MRNISESTWLCLFRGQLLSSPVRGSKVTKFLYVNELDRYSNWFLSISVCLHREARGLRGANIREAQHL